MQRYFANNVDVNYIYLEDSDVFHATKVMRMRVKDKLVAIYQKQVYLGEVISLNPFKVKNLGIKEEINRELSIPVTLFFALAKGDKIDFVIQKATELGASNIVLIKLEHSIMKMDGADFVKKMNNRYLKIAKEASEQSERLMIPNIYGVYELNHIPSHLLAELNLVAYEKSSYDPIDFSLVNNAKSVSILIGPEGGISEKEIKLLESMGFIKVSLGKRILRTETAAVVALSMINMELEK